MIELEILLKLKFVFIKLVVRVQFTETPKYCLST